MNVLACSLPFSVTLILIVYTSGEFFAHASTAFGSSLVFMAIASIPLFILQKRPLESLANR